MNSCVLMAEIIKDPELRYTSENQTPIAEILVQFASLRTEDPPATLKVVGWGNLALDIKENYHKGDRVIIEGRLGMNTVERQGFKEKRAELTAARIHRSGLDTEWTLQSPTSAAEETNNSAGSFEQKIPATKAATGPQTAKSFEPTYTSEAASAFPFSQPQTSIPANPPSGQDLDDIPF